MVAECLNNFELGEIGYFKLYIVCWLITTCSIAVDIFYISIVCINMLHHPIDLHEYVLSVGIGTVSTVFIFYKIRESVVIPVCNRINASASIFRIVGFKIMDHFLSHKDIVVISIIYFRFGPLRSNSGK